MRIHKKYTKKKQSAGNDNGNNNGNNNKSSRIIEILSQNTNNVDLLQCRVDELKNLFGSEKECELFLVDSLQKVSVFKMIYDVNKDLFPETNNSQSYAYFSSFFQNRCNNRQQSPTEKGMFDEIINKLVDNKLKSLSDNINSIQRLQQNSQEEQQNSQELSTTILKSILRYYFGYPDNTTYENDPKCDASIAIVRLSIILVKLSENGNILQEKKNPIYQEIIAAIFNNIAKFMPENPEPNPSGLENPEGFSNPEGFAGGRSRKRKQKNKKTKKQKGGADITQFVKDSDSEFIKYHSIVNMMHTTGRQLQKTALFDAPYNFTSDVVWKKVKKSIGTQSNNKVTSSGRTKTDTLKMVGKVVGWSVLTGICGLLSGTGKVTAFILGGGVGFFRGVFNKIKYWSASNTLSDLTEIILNLPTIIRLLCNTLYLKTKNDQLTIDLSIDHIDEILPIVKSDGTIPHITSGDTLIDNNTFLNFIPNESVNSLGILFDNFGKNISNLEKKLSPLLTIQRSTVQLISNDAPPIPPRTNPPIPPRTNPINQLIYFTIFLCKIYISCVQAYNNIILNASPGLEIFNDDVKLIISHIKNKHLKILNNYKASVTEFNQNSDPQTMYDFFVRNS